MNTSDRCGRAVACAFSVLLLAAAEASGHEANDQKAEASAQQQPFGAESPTPTPMVGVSTASPHDHSSHAAAANSRDSEAVGHEGENNLPKPLAWLGKFHPPVTHFPIALLTAAALAELLLIRTGEASYRSVVRFCVHLGAGSAFLAATLGWCFAGVRLIDDEWAMTAHRWAGSCVALLSAGLLYLLAKAEASTNERDRFRIALFLAAGLVGATGFLGGALVYGLDHYAW